MIKPNPHKSLGAIALLAYIYVVGRLRNIKNLAMGRGSSHPGEEKPFVWFESNWDAYKVFREQVRSEWPSRSDNENMKALSMLPPRNYQKREDFELDAKIMRMFGVLENRPSPDPEIIAYDLSHPYSKKKYRYQDR